MREHQTLLNLGSHWDVPRELWLRIAQRTEEILAGRQALFPEPETVEQHAQRLARQLRTTGVGLSNKPDAAVVRVDLDSMEHQDSNAPNGSSPHRRGTRARLSVVLSGRRFIPAPGGEHTNAVKGKTMMSGSSPHGRGTL